MSKRYFADPEKALGKRRQEQEVLGFGGEAVVALLTPIVLAVATDALTHVATEFARPGHAGSRAVTAIRPAPAVAAGANQHRDGLLAGSVGHARAAGSDPQSAFDCVVSLDLPEVKANLLSDALVGSLAPPEP